MLGKVEIAIPIPCHENWQAMSATDKGRFCASCQKNVIDFTKASDRQIAAALRESDTLCGRFRPSQLERELIIPKEKNKFWVAASAAAITLLTTGNNQLFAQSPVNTEQTENKTDDVKVSTTDLNYFTLTGTLSNETEPLELVSVGIVNSNKFIFTDENGKFSIKIKSGDTVTFSLLGYIPAEVTFMEEPKSFTLIMKEKETYTTSGFVCVINKKRTFAGRVFHSVGNLFR